MPFAVPLNGRDRACTVSSTMPAAAKSFTHMQAPTTNATNNSTPVAWEYKLPNGEYQVSVSVGDPDQGADAESHTINVEGVKAVENYTGTAAASGPKCQAPRLRSATAWATVTDGKLTVDAVGGTNTKLGYVTIDSVPLAGLSAAAAPGAVSLDWDDLDGASGYRVWRGDTLPVSTAGAALATTTESSWTDTTATKGTVNYYAVAPAGTGAPATVAVTGPVLEDDAAPNRPELPRTYSFRNAAGTAPAGSTLDWGRNYANTRGHGWVSPGTSTPLSLVLNGRTRTEAGLDPKLTGLLHMQWNTVMGGAAASGTFRPGAWQLAVADGSYDVEVSVGDQAPGTDPTSHNLTVEGKPAITKFVPTADEPLQERDAHRRRRHRRVPDRGPHRRRQHQDQLHHRDADAERQEARSGDRAHRHRR